VSADRVPFGGVPIRATSLTEGVFVTGTPGAGKTQLMNETADPILRSIAGVSERSCWRNAFILAAKPRAVMNHLEHLGIPDDRIAIFNPEDMRCRPHDVSFDFSGSAGVFDYASLIVPKNPRAPDQFWRDGGVTLVESGLTTIDRARKLWYDEDSIYGCSSRARLKALVEREPELNSAVIESFYSGGSENRMQASVEFTLETHMKPLRVCAAQLQAARERGNPPFSFVRDWMGDGPRIVVVALSTAYSESWNPVMVPLKTSCAISAFKRGSVHTPLSPSLTLFWLDEFPQLLMSMRESDVLQFFALCRELGGVPLLGAQSESLLAAAAGEDVAKSVIGNLAFAAYGVTNDGRTAESASLAFGQHEVERVREDETHEPNVIKERRLEPDHFMRENAPGRFRFYCRAPGIGKWRYEMRLEDIIRRNRRLTQEHLDAEQRRKAPQARLKPWDRNDLIRLGLARPETGPWPPFVDPNGDWRPA